MPRSLHALARAKAADAADTFAEENLPAYLDLTEDHVWTAFSHVARHWKGRPQKLAARLLERNVPDYFYVQPGKSNELEAILRDAGLSERDYGLRAKKSKVYGEDADDEVVHVLSEDGRSSTSVKNHSFALTAYADKFESETLLVVFDGGQYDRIKRAVEHCVIKRTHREAVLSPQSRRKAV
ncbi:MAG TPA: hypothetical protein VFG30_23045 [Polyangiales bacterium]|nr:hypothetical protein [Polyangiales bacterium]